MKPILTRLFAGLFLLIAAQAFGQPTMTTNFVVTSPAAPSPYPIGTAIVIELRVTDFTDIESMQFPITYNKDAMRFDSLTNAAFFNWNAGNFVSTPGAGKIGVSWDGYSNGANMPFSFPNGTAIFKLHFTVIGNGTSTVNISGSAAPPAIDVIGNGDQVTLNYQSGGTPTIILGTGNPPPPPLVGFKIVANTIYIPQGERGCMPVTVNDFDKIVSMQWAMHWDNTVLNYECTRAYNLSGWSATDFNSTFLAGTLLAGWADPAGIGVDRADGARIVDVCFKAIGAPGATTTVTIDGVGFPPGNGSAEAYNASSVNVWSTGGVNGASGVSAPINIIVTSPPPFDVTYNVDTIPVAPNTQGCVAVKVKNFTGITNSEFALAYNPAELTYVSTDFGANPLTLQASNITHVANPGVVKFLWSKVGGATVANDAAIFSVCFNVIAPVGTVCDIEFTTTPCPTITGIGTAQSTGGVSMARHNGWIVSKTSGPTVNIVQNVSCNNGTNGSLSVSNPPNTTATTYAWAGPGINAGNQGLPSPTGLTAGTYTVTVTYSDGTTATGTKTLIAPPAIVQTSMVNTVSCFGGSNGAINLTVSGGTPGYTYLWAPGGSTAEDPTGLGVDIYKVTITDANGCTQVSGNITVSGFIAINVPTPVVTPVSCTGLSDGSIVINPTGGAGNYSYDWSNVPGTNNPKDLINMPAGPYSVTITDGNGCTKVFSGPNYTIGTPMPLVTTLVSKTDVKCQNTPTGTATITVTGGTGNLNYCWFTAPGPCASILQNPTNLAAGTYTVVVTDQNACTSTVQNVVIANAPSAVTVTSTTTPSPCFDQPSGSINTTPAGGWGNYTYAWSGPVTLNPIPNHTPVPGGLYTVTVTDGNQCTATHTVTVAGAPAITENKAVTHVSCFGNNNGSINLNLSGGNTPYIKVEWSNTTQLGASIINLAPGSYQPTVTDAQGCTKIFPAVVVNGPTAPIDAAATITEATQTGGAISMLMSGGTGNTATWTYSWTGPGGFTAATQNISGPTVVSGAYTVVVTDGNGCTRTFNFDVPNANVVLNTQIDTIINSCSQDGCIQFTVPAVAAAQMPFTLNWSSGTANGSLTNMSTLNPAICGLGAGIYTVTITAANGNSMVIAPIVVAQKDPASVNSNTTNPFSSQVKNGKIKLTPVSVLCQLQYQWGPEANNSTSNEVSNLGQGTFNVTITNPCSGCVSVQQFVLEYSPLACLISTGNPTCASSTDGLINVTIQGGFLPYTFEWTGPNGFTSSIEDLTDLEQGVYTLTTTDQDGRVCSQTQTLTPLSPLNITNVNELSQYGPYQVSGANMCDGVAAVVFTPGIGNSSIAWSNGVNTTNNGTLCGGAYSVTVTDASGCTSVWTDELSAPPAIAIQQLSAGVKCHDDCDGSARVFPSGGVGPYSVKWSTTQFDPLVNANGFSQAVNLCGGDYTVTITDDNDVEQVFTVNVPQPAPISADFSSTAPRNFNSCDGDILIQVTGAVLPITYVWSGNFGHTGNGERAEELCSGEFVEFFITDANGCTAYATDSVPYPEDGCFRVSPVITPGQQDGKNDYVVITCIETALENRMEIYNRWGQLVFESDDYTNNENDREHNWNGFNNSGEVLAEGVYYYVLTYQFIDDQGQTREGTRKGAINLLR